jgi:CheY-like chemotaxis protein
MKTRKREPSACVLIVDDDEIMREAASESLTLAGFEVLLAENGRLAVETLTRCRPDIVLMDVMMPEMDGFEATSAIRRLPDCAQIPILFMTALDDLESINRAFEVGATDFITKPINWVILVERIRFMIRATRLAKERHQLQKKLVQAQKMEALGTLAGGVAHDLNNVLAAIVSYPGILLLSLEADSPLRKPILAMQRAGQRAAEIVQDLLTLAKRGVSTKDSLNLNDLIQDYLQSPEHEKLMSHHPQVTVDARLGQDLHNFKGSAIHIQKTIMNLVTNAAEAQPDGGRIIISTTNHRFSDSPENAQSNRDGEWVALAVSDDGCGIAKADLNRIFEPFYTKKVMGRSGTGLGMAVVWGAVQDHHGHIDVVSRPDRGSTFTIYLPAAGDADPQAQRPIPHAEYMGNGERILVVDDIAEQREITSQLLTVLNYAPIAVSSGEAAIKFLKKEAVALLILDMIMDPGIDGLETFRQIVAFKPDQKAIITSGYAETDRVEQAMRLGAGPFLKKPYTLEALGKTIMDALRG